MTEYVLYNSDPIEAYGRDNAEDMYREMCDIPADEDIDENDFYDFMCEQANSDYDCFMWDCRRVPGEFVVLGKLGLWWGSPDVWGIKPTLVDAIRACVEEMDSFKVVEDGRGKLQIIAHHHDGTNIFTLRKLKRHCDTRKSAIRNSVNAHLRKWI